MKTPSPTALIALLILSTALIPLGDTAGKLLTGGGAPPLFVSWTRFLIGAVLLAPVLGLGRGVFRALRDWRVVARGVLITCGITCILFAAKTEPLANVFGAFFIGPVVAYILAATLLREQITWLRSLLIGLGFCGVLLVVQPGGAISPGILFALAAGCCYGTFVTATRWLAGQYEANHLLMSQLLIGAVLLTPFEVADIPPIDLRLSGLVALSALASGLGNLLLVQVSGHLRASVIAPLLYCQLIFATLFGVAVFGDWPDWVAGAGLVVILISGLASYWAAERRSTR